MKQALNGYTTQVFQGSEATADKRFNREPVEPQLWYLGQADGTVDYGPFVDEASAVREMGFITDTRGT